MNFKQKVIYATTQKKGFIQLNYNEDNRCLSPLRCNHNKSPIRNFGKNIDRGFSPLRRSPTPTKLRPNDYNKNITYITRTPRKSKSPMRPKTPTKSPELEKYIKMQFTTGKNLTRQDFQKNCKLFSKLMSKGFEKQKQNVDESANKQQQLNINKNNNKNSFSSILNQIKAIESIQVINKPNDHEKYSNRQFQKKNNPLISIISPRSKMNQTSDRPEHVLQRRISEQTAPQPRTQPFRYFSLLPPANDTINTTINENQVQIQEKQVEEDFDDVLFFLKKAKQSHYIQKNEDKLEVNLSLDRPDESLTMEPFLKK